jgi:glutathione synthase/RimK-type ligase-like ATP-grasp enzyme
VPRVALATCAALPELDPDDQLVLPFLAERGIDAVPAIWDDPAVDWSAFDLTVVRNPWDYIHRRDAFVAWAERVPRIANSAEILAWNTDKRYLAELDAAGLPIVPTTFVAPGEAAEAPVAAEVVVKPTVSAGSQDTERHRADDHAAIAAHVARLHAAGKTAMVQPYLAEVDTAGETALLYFGGAFSHAIRKGPMLHPGAVVEKDLYVQEDISAREPSAAERALADRVVAFATARFGTPLYARVDLLPHGDAPVVIELELTEPSLFVGHAAGAPARFADAIAALL